MAIMRTGAHVNTGFFYLNVNTGLILTFSPYMIASSMFLNSVRRLRIMRASEANGLGKQMHYLSHFLLSPSVSCFL